MKIKKYTAGDSNSKTSELEKETTTTGFLLPYNNNLYSRYTDISYIALEFKKFQLSSP